MEGSQSTTHSGLNSNGNIFKEFHDKLLTSLYKKKKRKETFFLYVLLYVDFGGCEFFITARSFAWIPPSLLAYFQILLGRVSLMKHFIWKISTQTKHKENTKKKIDDDGDISGVFTFLLFRDASSNVLFEEPEEKRGRYSNLCSALSTASQQHAGPYLCVSTM